MEEENDEDGAQAVSQARALQPDVILMDLVMPKMDGIEATRQITEQQAGAHILVLTSFAANEKVFPAIKAGALGYLLKDSGPDELVEAIHQMQRCVLRHCRVALQIRIRGDLSRILSIASEKGLTGCQVFCFAARFAVHSFIMI